MGENRVRVRGLSTFALSPPAEPDRALLVARHVCERVLLEERVVVTLRKPLLPAHRERIGRRRIGARVGILSPQEAVIRAEHLGIVGALRPTRLAQLRAVAVEERVVAQVVLVPIEGVHPTHSTRLRTRLR